MKTCTPVAALAPYGSIKFLPLMTKIGQVKAPVAQERMPLAPYGSLQNLRLVSKVGVVKAPE